MQFLLLLCSFPEGPHFAAVNKNNEIIVTDFHNHSVKVLTKYRRLVVLLKGTFNKTCKCGPCHSFSDLVRYSLLTEIWC